MSNIVLDASAVLALLNAEPGSEIVAQALVTGAAMSTVNLSEVVAKLSEAGMAENTVREAVQLLGIQLVDFDTETAYQAGPLRTATRAARLSLGDRACLALAQRLGVPAITTDRVWETLARGVVVRIARPPAPSSESSAPPDS